MNLKGESPLVRDYDEIEIYMKCRWGILIWIFLPEMIEIVCNDRLGKKIRVKCNADDTVGDLKKIIAAQVGSRPEKIRLQRWYSVFKDHITLQDYEIGNGSNLELYYN